MPQTGSFEIATARPSPACSYMRVMMGVVRLSPPPRYPNWVYKALVWYTRSGYGKHAQPNAKSSCVKRLNRIEGQVRGLTRMVEEDRYCIDVITQVSAVRAALKRVEEEVLRDHVAHCVEHAISAGDRAEQRQKIGELRCACSARDVTVAAHPFSRFAGEGGLAKRGRMKGGSARRSLIAIAASFEHGAPSFEAHPALRANVSREAGKGSFPMPPPPYSSPRSSP